jgi:hypothetical protein
VLHARGCHWLVGRLRQTVEIDGPGLSLPWVGLAISALVACAFRFWRPMRAPESPVEQRARAVFFSVALLVGVFGYATFLILVGYPTQSWYYLSLLGLAAVLIESSLQLQTGNSLGWRVLRLGIVVVSVALAAPGVWQAVPMRMTNVDRVAAALKDQSRPDDLILVAPWYLGISFDHYYTGSTPWLSVPDLSDHKLTRYDLVKDLMTRPGAPDRRPRGDAQRHEGLARRRAARRWQPRPFPGGAGLATRLARATTSVVARGGAPPAEHASRMRQVRSRMAR